MNYNYSAQKAALTRAERSGDPQQVLNVCRAAVAEWNATYWPDGWHRWNIALYDACGIGLDSL